MITVFGRGAVCINSGGEKIFPEEVEEVLKAHPAVEDAVVVGVPDERWGQKVAAVVQPKPGRTLTLKAPDGELEGTATDTAIELNGQGAPLKLARQGA